jgi:hypothetical protein
MKRRHAAHRIIGSCFYNIGGCCKCEHWRMLVNVSRLNQTTMLKLWGGDQTVRNVTARDLMGMRVRFPLSSSGFNVLL